MTMKLGYDPQADALYMRITQADIVESEEAQPGLIIDFDADGKIVGMEFLNAKDRFSQEAIRGFSQAA